jgi:DNA-binding MarR family transcriptional regulator
VSLTEKGREVVASIDEVEDPAPRPFASLSQAELRTLETILAKLAAG